MSAHAHSLLSHLHRLTAPAAADAALWIRWTQQRDQQAFAALMARHGPMVLGVCRRLLGDVQEAEDVFQAVFLVLSRQASRLRQPESLAGFLHTVAVRLARKARAAKSRRQQMQTTDESPQPIDPQPHPLDVLTGRELLALVDDEIARLPTRNRLPVVLCLLQGRTIEEAARQLGWSIGSVRGRLVRGRERLRQRLARRGLDLSVGVVALLAPGTVPEKLSAESLRQLTGPVPAAISALVSGAMPALRLKTLGLVLLVMTAVGLGAGFSLRSKPEPPAPAVSSPAVSPPQAKSEPRRDRYGDPLPPGAVARLGSLRFRYEGPAQEGLVYSPDGKILAGVCRTGIIFWDAQSGRELRRFEVRISAIWSRPFDFSPDGATLAALDIASKIHFWDVATGRLLRTVAAPKAAHYQGDILHYSPDGKQLAIGWRESSVHLVDAATGKELRQFRIERRQVSDFAFAPDGKTLALASSDPTVSIWEVSTGKLLRTIKAEPKDKFPSTVAFTPDGKWVAAGCWDYILVAESATGKEIAHLEAKCESVTGLAFTRDGRTLLSSSQDGKLRFWDLETKKLRVASDNRHRLGRCLALSPDGKTVAMGTGGIFVRLWDVASGKERFTQYAGPDSRIMSVVFSPDGRTLFASEEDRQVHLWDTASWSEKESFAGGRQLALTADGRQMAWADAKNTIHIRDVGADHDRREWSINGTDYVVGLAFASNAGRLVTVDHKRGGPPPMNLNRWGTTRLVLWDTATGKARQEITLPPVSPGYLAVSSDGAKAYLSGRLPPKDGRMEDAILVCDLEHGQLVSSLKGHEQSIASLTLSADGRILASMAFDQTLRLWETVSAKEIRVWSKQRSVAAALAFSPDGRILASADGEPRGLVYDVPEPPRIHLWDVATGKEIAQYEGHQARVWALAFSPDGKRLATVQGDSTILIWDISAAAAVPSRPRELDRPALTAAWNDLASAETPKALQAVWKLETAPHDSVALLKEHLRPVQAIEAERIRQWIAGLDSDPFATREKAVENLIAADRQAEPALLRTLKENPTLEMRRRVQAVLERLHGPVTRPDLLQALRTVAVLEAIGTSEARRLLAELAQGAAEARLTREAKAVLQRLERRSAGK